jgi:hypothetical protein
MGISEFLQSTYKDMLDYLGLSNFAFAIIALLMISLFALLLMLKRMGIILTSFNVVKVTWPQTTIIYKQYQGEYQRIGPQFDLIRREVQATFPKSQMFGIYYDEPTRVADPTKCRAVVGIAVDVEEVNKVAEFVTRYVGYEKQELQ